MARMESPPNQEKKRITVRVPADLADQYDEAVTNRSEAIRAHMRAVCNRDDRPGRVPPQDDEVLAKGYNALRNAANGGGMPVDEAESLVASMCGIPKKSANRRVLKPLKKRGYITNGGDPVNQPWVFIN